jgi:hypothetical protein
MSQDKLTFSASGDVKEEGGVFYPLVWEWLGDAPKIGTVYHIPFKNRTACKFMAEALVLELIHARQIQVQSWSDMLRDEFRERVSILPSYVPNAMPEDCDYWYYIQRVGSIPTQWKPNAEGKMPKTPYKVFGENGKLYCMFHPMGMTKEEIVPFLYDFIKHGMVDKK